jgi:hypothetical protein
MCGQGFLARSSPQQGQLEWPGHGQLCGTMREVPSPADSGGRPTAQHTRGAERVADSPVLRCPGAEALWNPVDPQRVSAATPSGVQWQAVRAIRATSPCPTSRTPPTRGLLTGAARQWAGCARLVEVPPVLGPPHGAIGDGQRRALWLPGLHEPGLPGGSGSRQTYRLPACPKQPASFRQPCAANGRYASDRGARNIRGTRSSLPH